MLSGSGDGTPRVLPVGRGSSAAPWKAARRVGPETLAQHRHSIQQPHVRAQNTEQTLEGMFVRPRSRQSRPPAPTWGQLERPCHREGRMWYVRVRNGQFSVMLCEVRVHKKLQLRKQSEGSPSCPQTCPLRADSSPTGWGRFSRTSPHVWCHIQSPGLSPEKRLLSEETHP